MRTADFDYDLPPDRIAQTPAARREESRLLVLHRPESRVEHRRFHELPDLLRAGDLLVVNDSRVIPARLRGFKAGSGGRFEILLADRVSDHEWWVLLKPGRRVRVGTELRFSTARGRETSLRATVLEKSGEGLCRLRFFGAANLIDAVEELGEVPLPPYIARTPGADDRADRERYQTVYAREKGSVAAPTAGLHFSPALLETLETRGIEMVRLTLHVGLGTFAPVKAEALTDHALHEESFELGADAAGRINAARSAGRRVVAVGTTCVRVLEHVAAHHDGALVACRGRTAIFIYPPFSFRVVDGLITNFHLPRSTLLMLVSALAAPGSTAGRDAVLRAYQEAIRAGYRFYSYGDAMLIV